jgi:hypothetical protein
MTVIVGIDPGFSGAVAFLWPNMKLEIHDMCHAVWQRSAFQTAQRCSSASKTTAGQRQR